jgi:hypothetical protein
MADIKFRRFMTASSFVALNRKLRPLAGSSSLTPLKKSHRKAKSSLLALALVTKQAS